MEGSDRTATPDPSAATVADVRESESDSESDSETAAELRAKQRVKRGLFEQPNRPIALSRYVLLERVGAGGLGVVYTAYDPSLDRRVAIKLLQDRHRDDPRSDRSRERLVREAQAIAKLSHPNVVAVHDVGTYSLDEVLPGIESEGIFLVMEYVEGEDLEAWARESARSRGRRWTEILEVYIAAGRGLEAAHRAGLVHRDFKPSNVLVGRDGRARVLDFGLARDFSTERRAAAPTRSPSSSPVSSSGASESQLEIAVREKSERLTLAGRLVGTPAYMAPEQHRGEPADERSDQFAFCVAVWEALYGARPFAGKDIATLATAKATGAIVPPPRSTPVPNAVSRVLGRGLSTDPSARFRDMGELLAALAAIPRRRRVLAFAGAATLAVGLIAVPVAWKGASPGPCRGAAAASDEVWNPERRAEVEARFASSTRAFAPAAAHAVVAGLDAYIGEWAARRQEVCEATLIRGEASRDAMERTAACLDHHLARAAEVVALVREADDDLMVRAIDAVDWLPTLASCAAVDPTQVATEADSELLHRLDRALALADAAQHEDALAVAESVRQDAERRGGALVVSQALLVIGRMHTLAGRWSQGRDRLHEALAAAERAGDQATAVAALLELANGLVDAAEPEWSERMLDLAGAKLDHHGLGDALRYAHMHQRVKLLRFEGRGHEAVDAAERALAMAERHFPEGHLTRARAHSTLAMMLVDRGDSELAREQFRLARAILEERLGPDHPYVADSLENEALMEDQAGRYEAGLRLHLRALDLRERAYGPEHKQVAFSCANLSTTYERLGDLEKSLEFARRAQRLLIAAHGERHPDVGAVLGNVTNTLLDAGAFDEALATARQAASTLEESLGSQHPRTALAVATEGITLSEVGRYAEAIAKLERAREILEREMGTRHPALPLLYKATAEAELASNQRARARVHLERALGLFADGSHDPLDVARTQLLLARVLRPTDPARAGALTEQARTQWLAAGKPASTFEAVAQWLPGQRDPPPSATEKVPRSGGQTP